MTPFAERYHQRVVPLFTKEFGASSVMAIPKLTKIVLNVGVSAGNKDPKFAEAVVTSLSHITGQKPVPTLAKKSISNFKIRKGQVVGYKTTLRGPRLEAFFEKLLRITLPRVRDFRGILETAVDPHGNLNIGFRESIAFPEIRPDEVERLHGLELALVTTARTRERGLAFFRALGIPFKKP